jgi:hypothetical protein
MSTYKTNIKLEFFNKTRALGLHASPSQVPQKKMRLPRINIPKINRAITGVTPGNIAVVMQEGGTVDNFESEEVYFGGDQIIKQSILGITSWKIIDLYQMPGRIEINDEIPMPCLPQVQKDDYFKIRFMYDVQLSDPIKLLGRVKGWETDPEKAFSDKASEIITEVENEIAHLMMDGGLHICTHPKLEEVQAEIIESLSNKLSYYGLFINPHSISGVRLVPDIVYEVAFEFRQVEIDIIPSIQQPNLRLINKIGLDESDLVSIDANYQNYGRGAGLFLNAIKDSDKARLGKYISFLQGSNNPANHAADFLQEFSTGNYSQKDFEFTKLIMMSVFRDPLVGVGDKFDWDAIDELDFDNRRIEEAIASISD